MKRLFISIFILIMITGLSVLCLGSLEKDSEELTQKLSEISASAVNDKVPERLLTELGSLWNDFSRKSSLQINSEHIDDIGAELSRFIEQASAGSDDIAAQAAYLSTSISDLYKRQSLRIESLL